MHNKTTTYKVTGGCMSLIMIFKNGPNFSHTTCQLREAQNPIRSKKKIKKIE